MMPHERCAAGRGRGLAIVKRDWVPVRLVRAFGGGSRKVSHPLAEHPLAQLLGERHCLANAAPPHMRPAAHGAREAAGGPGGVPRVTEALVLMVYLLIRASDDGRTNPPEVDPAEPFPQLLGVCEYAQPPARLAQLQHAGS